MESIDAFVFLTPLLVLGVMLLVRFVGCNYAFGIDYVELRLDPPLAIVAVPRNREVGVSWLYPAGAAMSFEVHYGTTPGGPYPNILSVQPAVGSAHAASITTVTGGVPLANGTEYFFRVVAKDGDKSSLLEDSAEVSATPGTTFVVSKTLGTVRNNFSGWVGMVVNVAGQPITVTQLGHIVVTGNGAAHDVRIVDAATGLVLGSVSVPTQPTVPAGDFAYADLPAPVILQPGTRYFIVSHEDANGDRWHDSDTVVMTTTVAAVAAGVFNDDAAPAYVVAGGPGQTYGPVDFRY